MKDRAFPGKIILFGEYTVLMGYRALALPFEKCSGQWQMTEEKDDRLTEWLTFLKKSDNRPAWLSDSMLNRFAHDIEQGLQFQSSIPTGYGVGSSGALVAAWYARYVDASSDLSLVELQVRCSSLEAYFHGQSSGLDPLVSYLGQALMVHEDTVEQVSGLPLSFPDQLQLVDTGIARSTAPIVQLFHEKNKAAAFRETVLPSLGRAQELAIDAYILADWQNVAAQFRIISQLQYAHFNEMIPQALRAAWQAGWEQGIYHKLCGAGGGGYMLKWTVA